jgi:hypothetical protein
MRTVKWGVDWMLKAHFNASDVPSLNQLVVQVGPGCEATTVPAALRAAAAAIVKP